MNKPVKTKVPKSGVKAKRISVIYFDDIPYSNRLERPFEDPSYGDAELTLVKAIALLNDPAMKDDGGGVPECREPTWRELASPTNLQPLAWELWKIAKTRKVLAALRG